MPSSIIGLRRNAMPNSTEDEVIQKLRERTARGELAGIDVVYHVNGGSPVEQEVDEEIQLSGRGEVRGSRAYAGGHHAGGIRNGAAPAAHRNPATDRRERGRSDPAIGSALHSRLRRRAGISDRRRPGGLVVFPCGSRTSEAARKGAVSSSRCCSRQPGASAQTDPAAMRATS